MKKYVKFNNFWWELEDSGFVCNRVGGRHAYDPEFDGPIVEAESFEDLDWSCLIKPDSKCGWLSPDGRFYGCGYSDHADVADLYFKKSERELEDEGWIKISMSCFTHELSWYNTKLMVTEAQRIVLEKMGLKVDPDVCELVVPTVGGGK